MLRKLNFLKRLDTYLGIPVCYILSFFPKKSTPISKVEKVLVMKFWGMGSIILATPALKLIKEKYPSASITFLTLSQNIGTCRAYPSLIDEVISVDLTRGFLYFIYDFIRKTILINKRKYQLLFDFEFFTRFSACVAFLSGAPNTVGFHAWHVYRGDLHTINVVFNKYWHVIDNFCNLVSLGAYRRKENPPPLERIETDRINQDSIKNLLPADSSSKKIIVVNINAEVLALERRWPRQYYRVIIEKISNYKDIKVILIGSKAQAEYVNDLYASFEDNDSVANLTGKTNFKSLALLMQKAFLFIGNDSGPLHLAISSGLPTVSFFGPETPVIYGPIGDKHLIFYTGIACSPCINIETTKTVICYNRSPICMESINPDEVWQKVSAKYFNHLPLKSSPRPTTIYE